MAVSPARLVEAQESMLATACITEYAMPSLSEQIDSDLVVRR